MEGKRRSSSREELKTSKTRGDSATGSGAINCCPRAEAPQLLKVEYSVAPNRFPYMMKEKDRKRLESMQTSAMLCLFGFE